MSTQFSRLLAAALAAFFLLVGTSAHASPTTYSFAYTDVGTGGTLVNASGLFTVTPSGSNFLITAISGTYNGSAIASLFAPGGFQGNDNILYSTGPQLSVLGFAFSVAGGGNVDVYHDTTGQFICAGCFGSYYEPGGVDTVISFSATPVPLPAAAWLLFTGLAALGFVGRRRAVA